MDPAGKDKATYVKATFNKIADKYDLMNTLMSLGMDHLWRKKVVQIVQAQEGMYFLDVCCGTGMLTRELSRNVTPKGKVIGLDFSENMLQQACQSSQESAYNNIEYLQGDAMSLPFEDNRFDGVTVGWGLRNLPSARQGIREMARVVKPGAMVVSIDMGKPSIPIIKDIYWVAFARIIPFMAKITAGKKEEYYYLYESARDFATPLELKEMFQASGLVNTGYQNLLGGAIAIVYGQKAH